MSIASQLEKLGWELECDVEGRINRAICGNFKTPWRSTPESVLNDVLAIKAKENASVVQAFEGGRWK